MPKNKYKFEVYGNVNEGKPNPNFIKQILNGLVSFPDCRISANIEKIYKKRSNNQLSYYWGVIIDKYIIGYEEMQGYEMSYEFKNMNTGEIMRVPMNHEEKKNFAHKELKLIFNENKSTTSNTTIEQEEYHQLCREYILTFFNIRVELPNENLIINTNDTERIF